VFAIKHIQEIVGKYGAYLQLNYWEKESKSIKFKGMYFVLLNSSQTEGQHVDYLIELLNEV